MPQPSASPLDILHQHGLNAVAKGDRLEVFPARLLTDDLRHYIRQHKPEIIERLTRKRALQVFNVIVDRTEITVIDPGRETEEQFTESMYRKFGTERIQGIELKRRQE